jgi:Fe-S cluster assembly protein SufD
VQPSANLIDNTYVSQQESSVAVNTYSFGGNLTRNNLNFYHFGRIVSYLNGITIIGEKQHDHYTLVQHASQIAKVTKITKDSLTAQQAFSTEKFS